VENPFCFYCGEEKPEQKIHNYFCDKCEQKMKEELEEKERLKFVSKHSE